MLSVQQICSISFLTNEANKANTQVKRTDSSKSTVHTTVYKDSVSCTFLCLQSLFVQCSSWQKMQQMCLQNMWCNYKTSIVAFRLFFLSAAQDLWVYLHLRRVSLCCRELHIFCSAGYCKNTLQLSPSCVWGILLYSYPIVSQLQNCFSLTPFPTGENS